MKALCWHGKNDVRVDDVADPRIEEPGDVILKVTSTAICGSDLHLLDGYMPTMESGDVLGHEFMGEVVEAGKSVERLRKGDRVVIPFAIACGQCFFCERQLWSCCDNTNPNAETAATAMGHSPAGLFGYSHMGQTHVHRYMPGLLDRIEKGEIDSSFVITHRLPLSDAAQAYKTFRDKEDGCIKVVLRP